MLRKTLSFEDEIIPIRIIYRCKGEKDYSQSEIYFLGCIIHLSIDIYIQIYTYINHQHHWYIRYPISFQHVNNTKHRHINLCDKDYRCF